MKISVTKVRLSFPFFLVLAAVVLAPAEALAQAPRTGGPFSQPGPHGFGAQGQFAIDGQLQFELNKTSGSNAVINIQPALDYFIAPNISVGGVVGLKVETGDSGSTDVLLGARAGYNLNISDRVSFWPTLGLSYEHISFGNSRGSDSATYMNIFAPFLFHPVQHLFIGVGPFMNVGLGDGDPNHFGISSVVGGWL
jgi:hypothetical protein